MAFARQSVASSGYLLIELDFHFGHEAHLGMLHTLMCNNFAIPEHETGTDHRFDTPWPVRVPAFHHILAFPFAPSLHPPRHEHECTDKNHACISPHPLSLIRISIDSHIFVPIPALASDGVCLPYEGA